MSRKHQHGNLAPKCTSQWHGLSRDLCSLSAKGRDPRECIWRAAEASFSPYFQCRPQPVVRPEALAVHTNFDILIEFLENFGDAGDFGLASLVPCEEKSASKICSATLNDAMQYTWSSESWL